MLSGRDRNTGRQPMERLARLTPHGLAVLGSRIDPSTCIAHGSVGAVMVRERMDGLRPCSLSGLIGMALGRRIVAAALEPVANAPYCSAAASELLERSGIRLLSDRRVHAGAPIADSMERYAPQAWGEVDPVRVEGFVARPERARCSRFLLERPRVLASASALAAVSAVEAQGRIDLWVAG
jgi:leucine dehydrogenase